MTSPISLSYAFVDNKSLFDYVVICYKVVIMRNPKITTKYFIYENWIEWKILWPRATIWCHTNWLSLYPLSMKLKGGILVSPCPSIRLWTESCPLCIFHNIHRIHFIFTHLIKQLQKVCHVLSFFPILKKFEVLVNSLNLQLWLCLVMTWDPIWIDSMGNHGRRGYPQNAGIPVVLVGSGYMLSSVNDIEKLWLFHSGPIS